MFALAGILASDAIGAHGPASADTVINETSFHLKLPGAWKNGKVDDPSRRTYRTDKEQLTVSIFGSMFGIGKIDHPRKVARFKRTVNKRRDAETLLPNSDDIRTTEPTFGESDGTLAARYAGFDPIRQRRFHCLILASASAFEVFYYEAVNMPKGVAEDRAKVIFDSAQIPK